MRNNVAVILLNYNNFQATIDCVGRLNKIGVPDKNIFVIDNNSPNDSFERLNKNLKGVNVLKTGINGGYAYGNNYGLKRVIELNYHYVCIMNTDIFFKNDFISPLLDFLKTNKDVGVVGPCLRFVDNGKIASAGGTFRLFTGKSSFNYMHEDYINRGPIDCDYISGGCLVTSVKSLKDVGFIPEDYFLDYEDNEWCHNFKKKGYRVVCLTSVYVFHEGESTINTVSGLNLYFMYRNRIIFEKRNANFIQKLVFYPYIVGILLISLFVKKRRSSVKAYIDGFLGRNKYSYLIR